MMHRLPPLRTRVPRMRTASSPASSLYIHPATTALRPFSTTSTRREMLDISALPTRVIPKYEDKPNTHLLSLNWPRPPQNILLIPKHRAPHVKHSAVAFAKYLHSSYPNLNLIFEPDVAAELHGALPFPIYSSSRMTTAMPSKVDIVTTLGGDGTILRAASLFSLHEDVPPILAFSMGTLGFLGEWKFEEYKRAWREVYMSGSNVSVEDLQGPHTRVAAGGKPPAVPGQPSDWDQVKGQSMGAQRASKMLLRHRLKVGLYASSGENLNTRLLPTPNIDPDLRLPEASAASECAYQSSRDPPSSIHVINELLIHRGPHPHLVIMDIFINGRFLTEAVADGIIVSTPTGSTAYSLSAGGSIVHPLVKSILITPICPRSLSFRPLVVPLNTRVSLRLSEKNRGRDLEVSVDGKRRAGMDVGMEIRVEGEEIVQSENGGWRGGVPCVIRTPTKEGERGDDDDGWVGGLNGLLKFNYAFGDAPEGH